MNRKYEFVITTPVTNISNEEDYINCAAENRMETQSKISELNASESYSIKPSYAGGKYFYSGFFVDRSAIRRPSQMPAGETWRYAEFKFNDSTEMIEKKDLVVDCLNNPNLLEKYTKVELDDKQIYYSKVLFDIYGKDGTWTIMFKEN